MAEDSAEAAKNQDESQVQDADQQSEAVDVEAVEQDSDSEGGVKNKPRTPSNSPVTMLGDTYEIHSDQPLEKRNVGKSKAFHVVSKASPDDSYFALVCEPHLLPRSRPASAYSGFSSPVLIPLAAHGKVFWPPHKKEQYVFVYKDTLGERLLEPKGTLALGWDPDHIVDVIIKPMIDTLQEFEDRKFVHGSIRVDNMHDGGVAVNKLDRVVFGDCLSMPCSYAQSTLYETIERGMADPFARGPGLMTNDLYALGVCVAVLMRSHDPLAGLSEDEIIYEKVRQGSYAAIIGKDRVKGPVLELLRGLLHDDSTQRWTLEDVTVWLDGRRLSPKQSVRKKTASRPFAFLDEKHSQAQTLAMRFDDSQSDTVAIVEDGSLEQWLERSLEDDDTVERVETAKRVAKDTIRSSTTYPYLIAATLSAALDLNAPLRFRGYSMMGDGIGPALYKASLLKEDLKGFADLFAQSVAMYWITVTENPDVDKTTLISRYDNCRGYLRHNKVGFGLERCLYFLAPEAPCLSPKLEGYYVTSAEEMITAFEDLCQSGQINGLFLDRHSIAYLAANEGKVIDAYLYDLNLGDDNKKTLANLACLAAIQKRLNTGSTPGIARVFADMAPKLLKRFHDRDVRDELRGDLEKYAKQGDLSKMIGLLNSASTIDKDMRAFTQAMAEFSELRKENQKLEEQFEHEGTMGVATGRNIAAIVSGVLAVVTIVITTLLFY